MHNQQSGSPAVTNRAIGATFWSGLELSARHLPQLAVMIVLARLLPPSDFGLAALVVAFTAVGFLLVEAGLGTALIQRQTLEEDDLSSAMAFSIVSGLMLTASLWLGAPLIESAFGLASLTEIARLMAWSLLFMGIAVVPEAILTARLDFRARAHAELIASISGGGIAICLALMDFGAISLAWQAVVASGLRAAMLWWLSGWRPAGHYRWQSLRSLWAVGLYMMLANLMDTFTTRIQAVLIGYFFDARTLGFFSVAQNTQQAPVSLLGGVLNRVGLPIFSVVAKKPDKLLGGLRLSLKISMFIFMPIMLGISLTSEMLVVTLYGDSWRPAAPILAVLCAAVSIWPIHILNISALSALGRTDIVLRIEIIKKSLALVAIVVAAPFGPLGIAYALLAVSLVSVIVNTHYSAALLDYGLTAQLRDIAGGTTITLLAIGTATATKYALEPGALNLSLTLLVGASAQLILAIVFRHPAIALARSAVCSTLSDTSRTR